MARKIRIQFEGAIYHVMSRGNRRERIFKSQGDREDFLEILAEACARTGWRIYAYVLMGNHYHWLLETPEPNLVSGMRWFQTTYSVRFNLRHRRVGHLFQGRYKAVLVDGDAREYLATLSDYIHLNPARAGMAGEGGRLIDFQWSSLPHYARSPRQRPHWLEVGRVLGELGYRDDAKGRRAYVQRMEERRKEAMDEAELAQVRRGWLIGGEAFRDRILDLMEGLAGGVGGRKLRAEHVDRDHGERQAERIIVRALERFGVAEEDLLRARKGDWRKRLMAYQIRQTTSVSLRWLSQRLRMGSEGHVSRVAAKIDDLARHPEARRHRKALA